MMMMMRGARTLSSSFRLLRRFGSSSIPAAPSSMGNSFAVDDATLVPCTAHHISRSLDHIRVLQRVYGRSAHRLYRDSVVISGPFRGMSSDSDEPLVKRGRGAALTATMKGLMPGGGGIAGDKSSAAAAAAAAAHVDASPPALGSDSHVALFAYGSVVFFNLTAEQRRAHLTAIKKHCSSNLVAGQQHTEDYLVVVMPNMEGSSRLEPDCVVVKSLDTDNLAVIGAVMAQTVALDQYSAVVDKMLDTFTDLNSSVEQTGVFTAMEKQNLFRLVAQNITVTLHLLKKLGLFEKDETAWKDADLNAVWEGLREEFELENRFRNLDFKLNLIQHNTKFFLEILHNQKSDKLEWVIIILISLEICVSLADMFKLAPFSG